MGYCSILMICFKAQISIITTSAYAAGMGKICLFSGCGITMTSLSVNNGRDETWVRNLGDGVTCSRYLPALSLAKAHKGSGGRKCEITALAESVSAGCEPTCRQIESDKIRF